MNQSGKKQIGALLLCALSLMAGCASDRSVFSKNDSAVDSSAAAQETIALCDDLGRQVSLSRPQRVAILIGSFADMYNSAGGGDQIVAVADDVDSFDLDLNDPVLLGGVKAISQESLLQAKPDLVIASARNESQKNMLELLEDAGIPVVYYDVSSFEDYLRVFRQMTQLTGDTQAWQQYGPDLQARMKQIRSSVETGQPLRVLALRETGKGIKALGSENSVLGEMLSDLNLENIAGVKGLDTLSKEYIHEQNPDWIFYVAQGKDLETAQKMGEALFEQDAWRDLDAVKNGQARVLDQRLYNLKPNARWAQALDALKTTVYDEKK